MVKMILNIGLKAIWLFAVWLGGAGFLFPQTAKAIDGFEFHISASDRQSSFTGALAAFITDEVKIYNIGVKAHIYNDKTPLKTLQLLAQHERESAFLPADILYRALDKDSPFSKKARLADLSDFRLIASLYEEALHITVTRESGLYQLGDIAGQDFITRLEDGQYSYLLADLFQALNGQNYDWQGEVGGPSPAYNRLNNSDITLQQAMNLLGERQISASLLMAPTPAPEIEAIMQTGQMRLMSLSGQTIDQLTRLSPYYTPITIRKNTYPKMAQPIDTVGITLLWLSHSEVAEEVIYQITKNFFEHKSALVQIHPALKNVTPISASHHQISLHHTIELHDGAKRYYRQQGLKID